MLLSLSFREGLTASPSLPELLPFGVDGAPLERYRIWDDLSETWYESGFELLRYENADVVYEEGRVEPLWAGSLDTLRRIVLVPDLDEEGFAINQTCDLRWRRV